MMLIDICEVLYFTYMMIQIDGHDLDQAHSVEINIHTILIEFMLFFQVTAQVFTPFVDSSREAVSSDLTRAGSPCKRA